MVIYEVNLTIDNACFSDYLSWLHVHLKEMLSLPGFLQATLLKPIEEASIDQTCLTVQYHIAHMDDLQRYLTEHAPMMREKGLKRFAEKFSATRRMFNVERNYTHSN